ncbi:MAG: energy-coupling factor transporter transmembrane protein EcfT, partial [Defluviitaleaceae bacterium]|nr:energy-coupling factor transporter transmembrane protein EcfT [Defluviitaleaceae bacterium]
LAVSLACAFAYSVYLHGRKAVRVGLMFMLPMMLFTALLNPLLNHRGATILAYLPGGNPLTLESILYGIAASVMMITVIAWFACFNTVMTSDKLVYLFGRVIPALSLIFSMSLRLVPRFKEQFGVISGVQKCVGRGVSDGSVSQKVRNAVRIMSIMVTWALENAIETAVSMKCRGYGLPDRTAFSIFRFCRRDACALAYILVCAAIVIAGAATGAYHFRYFPTVRGQWGGADTVAVFVAYLALAGFPMIVNIQEDLTWKRLESKI